MAHGRWLLAALAAGALARAADARAAGAYPVQLVERRLTLPAGMVELALTPTSDLSARRTGDALLVQPSLAVGVTDAVQLTVFSPVGWCFAVSGTECARSFDGIGAEVVAAVARDAPTEVALHGGAASLLGDPAFALASAGVAAKVHRERSALVFDAAIQLGMSDRDTVSRDAVLLTASFLVQLAREVALDVDTGIVTPFDTRQMGGARAILVPAAVGATYTPVPRLDLGVRFGFTNLLGTGATTDDRSARLLVALRL